MAGPGTNGPAPVPDTAEQFMVRMRDGVRLATDVYLPESGENIPAILVRLPYDKNSRYVFMDYVAERVTARGYALVVQDVRGKYRSEGLPLGPVNEVDDGYDTLSWITSNSWSNGAVGMFGDSYFGFTQYAAASTGHPALRAIVPRVTATDLTMNAGTVRNGVRDIPWGTGVAYLLQCWSGPHMEAVEPDWHHRPLIDALEAEFEKLGSRSPWFDASIPRKVETRVYTHGSILDARPIPTLHCVGWWDNMLIQHMRDFEQFSEHAGWNAQQYFWADSMDHENCHIDDAGKPLASQEEGDERLNASLEKYIGPALNFFDVFVKGEGSASDIPRASWHLAHGGERTDAAWPPPAATNRVLHLTGLDRMRTTGGALSWEPVTAAESGALDYDPLHPVASLVEDSFSYLVSYPDEQEFAKLDEVAVFETEELAADLDIAGPVRVRVCLESTGVTADLFARVLDVTPTGEAHLIARGQGEIVQPDGSSTSIIDLGHTGYRVRQGHRIRLTFTSSDYPEYLLNTSTGENRFTATDLQPAVHTLHARPDLTVGLELSVLTAE